MRQLLLLCLMLLLLCLLVLLQFMEKQKRVGNSSGCWLRQKTPIIHIIVNTPASPAHKRTHLSPFKDATLGPVITLGRRTTPRSAQLPVPSSQLPAAWCAMLDLLSLSLVLIARPSLAKKGADAAASWRALGITDDGATASYFRCNTVPSPPLSLFSLLPSLSPSLKRQLPLRLIALAAIKVSSALALGLGQFELIWFLIGCQRFRLRNWIIKL